MYRAVFRKSGTSLKEVSVEGAHHGYGAAIGKPEGFWLDEYIK